MGGEIGTSGQRTQGYIVRCVCVRAKQAEPTINEKSWRSRIQPLESPIKMLKTCQIRRPQKTSV